MLHADYCGLESNDPKYIASVKANVATAHAHGIEVGAYDLIGWTRNSNSAVPGSMALAPDGHSAGSGACWASSYADYLMQRVDQMANLTGLSMIETDGPYGKCIVPYDSTVPYRSIRLCSTVRIGLV